MAHLVGVTIEIIVQYTALWTSNIMVFTYKQNHESKRNKTEGKTVQQISMNSKIMLSEKNCTLITQNTVSISKEQFIW